MFFDKLILLLKVDDRAGAQTHKPRTAISHNTDKVTFGCCDTLVAGVHPDVR